MRVVLIMEVYTWQVLDNISVKYGLSFLDKLHFHNISYIDNDNMALSLGGFTEGVRVVDMAKGFSTLANNGSFSDRTCVKKIEHVSDGVVYKNNNEKTQVYSEDAAWMMTDGMAADQCTGIRYHTGYRYICSSFQPAGCR